MTDARKMAVEALRGLLACPSIADVDHDDPDWGCPETAEAERRAREALAALSAEPAPPETGEEKPVAWRWLGPKGGWEFSENKPSWNDDPLYTAAQLRAAYERGAREMRERAVGAALNECGIASNRIAAAIRALPLHEGGEDG